MPSNGFSLTTVFANESGQQPASQLDVNFNNLLTPLNALGTYANYFLDTGTVNALVVTIPSPLSASYAAGLILQVKVGNTNTGAATLNVNSLGAQSIVYTNGSAMAAGQLVAGGIAIVMYDGTNFQLLGAVAPSGSTAQRIYKATGTSRTSTTSLTADPDLNINVAAGTYLVEMCVLCNAALSSNGGINLQMYAGSAVTFGIYMYSSVGGTGIVNPGNSNLILTVLDNTLHIDTLWYQGVLQFASSGTISVHWAQNTSSTAATNVLATSYLGAIPLTSA